MPLETATYLSDLVVSNPAHTDGLSQADSHARLIKSVLKNTFPNFTDVALASTQAQIDAAVAVSSGAAAGAFPLGTALLPGLYPFGNPNTGLWSPAANQLAISLNGVQALLMGGTALVTTLGVAAAAILSTGAYSGGTGQLVPVGAVLEWYDDVLPAEGGYCWANGQIIASANTVCPVLLARWGSRFGGNGVTTMGVPDRRDTVAVGKSTMGGVASRALQTLTNTVLGTLFGLANNVLGLGNLPPITNVTGNITNGAITFPGAGRAVNNGGSINGMTLGDFVGTSNLTPLLVPLQAASSFSCTGGGGTSTPVNNVQPSTTCNFILRLA